MIYYINIHQSWAVSITAMSLFWLWSGLDISDKLNECTGLPLTFYHYLGTYLLENKHTHLHTQGEQKPAYGLQIFLFFPHLIRNEMFEKWLNSVLIFLRLKILDKMALIILFKKYVSALKTLTVAYSVHATVSERWSSILNHSVITETLSILQWKDS